MRRRTGRTSTSMAARLGSALVVGAVLTLGVGSASGAFASDAPEPATSTTSATSSASTPTATADDTPSSSTTSTAAEPSPTSDPSGAVSPITSDAPTATTPPPSGTGTGSASSTTSSPAPTTSEPTGSASSRTPQVTSTVGLVATPGTVKRAAVSAALPCTAGPITVKPTITVVPSVVHVDDIVRLTVTFTQPEPCPGDRLEVTMPPQFTDIGDFSFPFVDPDGNVLGTATIKGGKLVVILSGQVAGMSSLTLTGSYNQRVSHSATEGEDTLHFPTSGGDVPVPITVLPCVGTCQQFPTQASKTGRLIGNQLVMVGQTPTFAVPTTYTFTETLTSPGQQFVCPVTVNAHSFTGRDATGSPSGSKREPVTITSCTSTQVVGTSGTSRPNSFARLGWQVRVTDDQVSSWTDELSITTTRTWTADAEVKRQVGIGTGLGQFATTSTTTTTSTTVTTSATSSTTSTTTVPPTTPATTTPAPPPSLAFTGSEVMPILLAALALLALGGALILGSRRGSHG